MAGTLTIGTLSDGTNSTSSTNAIKGSAKAWCNYNGVSQVVRSSYNVSSVTRNSAGDYTFNLTTAMADANYSVSGSGQRSNSVEPGLFYVKTLATTSLRMVWGVGSFTPEDPNYALMAIFSN